MSRKYLNAGHCIDAIMTTRISLKSYISKKKIGKEEYALIINTIKYQDIINRILTSIDISATKLEIGWISYNLQSIVIIIISIIFR